MIKARFLSLILLVFISIPVFCETIAEPPCNYGKWFAGSRWNPYQISSLANLRWMSETPKVIGWTLAFPGTDFTLFVRRYHFVQTENIDASETVNWNDGCGFVPIGYFEVDLESAVPLHRQLAKNNFTGVYDGQNYTIDNLYIRHRSDHFDEWMQHPTNRGSHVGLFAGLNRATIKNVRLEQVEIHGYTVTGAIAGSSVRSTISSSSSSGIVTSIKPAGGILGGLVGNTKQTVIDGCFSRVSFENTGEFPHIIGGLVGISTESDFVKNSFYHGNMLTSGFHSIGGIIGVAGGNFPPNMTDELLKSYMQDGRYKNLHKKRSRIENVYVISDIPFSDSAGIAGDALNLMVENSFWSIDATGIVAPFNKMLFLTETSNTHGLLTAQMRDISSFPGWDFDNIWGMTPDINDGFPFLLNSR
jgi:hypothetical protein